MHSSSISRTPSPYRTGLCSTVFPVQNTKETSPSSEPQNKRSFFGVFTVIHHIPSRDPSTDDVPRSWTVSSRRGGQSRVSALHDDAYKLVMFWMGRYSCCLRWMWRGRSSLRWRKRWWLVAYWLIWFLSLKDEFVWLIALELCLWNEENGGFNGTLNTSRPVPGNALEGMVTMTTLLTMMVISRWTMQQYCVPADL